MTKPTISDEVNKNYQGFDEAETVQIEGKLEPQYDEPHLTYEMDDPLGIGNESRRVEFEKRQAELWLNNYQQRPELEQQDPNINLSEQFRPNTETIVTASPEQIQKNIEDQQAHNQSVSSASFMDNLSVEFKEKVETYKQDNPVQENEGHSHKQGIKQ